MNQKFIGEVRTSDKYPVVISMEMAENHQTRWRDLRVSIEKSEN